MKANPEKKNYQVGMLGSSFASLLVSHLVVLYSALPNESRKRMLTDWLTHIQAGDEVASQLLRAFTHAMISTKDPRVRVDETLKSFIESNRHFLIPDEKKEDA